MSELVSIITPMYNSKDFIESTLLSVQSQTYENWEMIVIDDCSDDDGPNIVKKISNNDSRIKLIMQKNNLGPSNARNTGIELAEGRYLAFLDSDDMWHEEKLDKQIKFMQSNKYAFTFTGYEKINEVGKASGIVMPFKKQVTYHDLLKSNHIGCLTAMLDLELIGEKKYMPNIKKRQDHCLWLEILKKVEKAYCLDQILGKYRLREGSVSINKINNIKYQWELYRNVEKMSILQSFYYMSFYAYYGFRKYNN